MMLRDLFSQRSSLRRSNDSSARRSRRPLSGIRPSVLEALEERLVLSPPAPVVPAPAVLFNAGTVTSNLVSGTDLTATPPNYESATDHSMVCSTVTNNSTTTSYTIGAAVYQDQQATAPVSLTDEVLLGFKDVTIGPGQSTTICVSNLDCMQFDVFVEKVGSTTVQNVVTQFPNESTSLFNTPAYSTFGPPVNNQANPQSTLIAFANTTGAGGSLVCPNTPPQSQGGWKHALGGSPVALLPTFTITGGTGAGTFTGLELGNTFYTQSQLSTLMTTPPKGGDATLQAVHQEIAAKLNLLNGGMPAASTGVLPAIQDVDNQLVAIQVGLGGSPVQTLIAGGGYNNNFFTKGGTIGTALNNDGNTLDNWQGS